VLVLLNEAVNVLAEGLIYFGMRLLRDINFNVIYSIKALNAVLTLVQDTIVTA
jgi:hypothetical protein